MNARRMGLYARTLPHLKPVQVFGRVWRNVRRASVDTSPPPPVRPQSGPEWTRCAAREPVLIGPTRVRLLEIESDVASAADWERERGDRLWTYHLHYFDDLSAQGARSRRAWQHTLLRRWIAENPPGVGTGWEAYPLSLRIVNWVKFALAGERLCDEELHSLAVQARFLRSTLEYHLLGNHLFANAKALVFAGLFFHGEEAAEWLSRGLSLLEREVREQVLADGGHFERSALYHSIVLEDLLDLLNLIDHYPRALPSRFARLPSAWRDVVPRMLAFLAAMVHPDGEIALFNDAVHGVAPRPSELLDYAERLGFARVAPPAQGVLHLHASGFVRVAKGSATAWFDVGALGPDYLAGHGHADSLGFELSLEDARLAVDSGTSQYAGGVERARQRSTAAHNTVVVDGADSSEVWDSFRVAARARTHDLELEDRGDRLVVACSHDGYRRLPGRVTHRRTWELDARGLVVADELSGEPRHAEGRLFFSPAVTQLGVFGLSARGLLGGRTKLAVGIEGARPTLVQSTWHPRFHTSLLSNCLVYPFEGRSARLALRWDRS